MILSLSGVLKSRAGRYFGACVGIAVFRFSEMVLDEASGKVFSNIALILGAFVAGFSSLVASRHSAERQKFWRRMAIATTSWGVGNIIWTAYESVLHQSPFPSLADVGYLGFSSFVVAAIFSLNVSPTSTAGKLRALLDGVMIALSVFLSSWTLLLRELMNASSEGTLAKVVSISYPLFDTITITLVLFAVVRFRQQALRIPAHLIWVAFGVLSFAVADSGFAYLTLKQRYTSGGVIDLGWFCAFILIGLGACERESTKQTGEVHVVSHALGELVPYFVIAAAVGVGLIYGHATFTGGVMFAWIGLFAAMMLRQVFSLVENIKLTRGLEARVAERTEELSVSERRFRRLVQRSSDVVTVVDSEYIVQHQSDSIEGIFGYPAEALVHRSVLDLLTHNEANQLISEIERSALDPERPRTIELELRHASGAPRVGEFTITNLLDDPAVNGVVLNCRDISEQRALERRLVHDAFHDGLTGLPNRSLFRDRLSHALTRSSRNSGVAVVFIDLDGFKRVNDSAGHSTGDLLLIETAARLQSGVRPGDTVARFGGDEFAVLLEDVGGKAGAISAVERIRDALTGSVTVDGHTIFLRGSLGVALAEADDTHESILRNADLAMYRAKANGEGDFAIFDHPMHDVLVERVTLEADLRRGLGNGELVNHYQPTFDLVTGQLVGFEALVRWNHPTRGLMEPGIFIPVAEDSGLIREIGRQVLQSACAHAASWRTEHPTFAAVSMSINVSAVELRDSDLVEFVRLCLENSGLAASSLVLEITESTLIADTEAVLVRLGELKELGIRLAIDDFGTGYSSLSSLHRYPVDVLKIDRSFVERLHEERDLEVARTIVRLGGSLSLTTVAEGIETMAQLNLLREAGCEIGQGFHYSRPVSADTVSALLSEWLATPTAIAG